MMTSVSFICPTTQPGIMFSFLKKKPAPAAVSEFGSLNSGFDKSSGFDENGGGTALGRSAPKPLRHHRALIGQLKHDHAVLAAKAPPMTIICRRYIFVILNDKSDPSILMV